MGTNTVARRPSVILYVLVLLAVSACAPRSLTPPEAGGPDWTQVRSEHFVIQSDAGHEPTRELAASLEQSYAALAQAGFPNADRPNGVTHVIHFARDVEFEALTGRLVAGLFGEFRALRLEPEPTLIFHGDFEGQARTLFQHELAHRFVAFYYPSAPIWLSEGMAEFFSTLFIEGDRVWMGQAIERTRGVRLRRSSAGMRVDGHWPDLKSLLGMDQSSFYTGGGETSNVQTHNTRQANYVAAWALVHTLSTEAKYRHRFQRYLTALSGRAVTSTGTAWGQAFSPAEERQLAADYQEKLVARRVKVLTAPAPQVRARARLKARTLRAAEVHLLWARIRSLNFPDQKAQIQQELAAAYAAEPDAIEVMLAQGLERLQADDLSGAEPYFSRALRQSSTDPKVLQAALLFELVRLSSNQTRASEALDERADQLASRARSVGQYLLLARYALYTQKYAAGLNWVRHALAQDRFCTECWIVSSLLFEGSGDLEQAYEAVRTAVGLMPEGPSSAQWFWRMQTLKAELMRPASVPLEDESESALRCRGWREPV